MVVEEGGKIEEEQEVGMEVAMDEDATGVLLDRLFRQALETGKRVRTLPVSNNELKKGA